MKLSELTETQRAEYDLLLDKKRRLLKEIKEIMVYKVINVYTVHQHFKCGNDFKI
jgi:hypothetical protein